MTSPKVTIYTTASCAFCKMAKTYFKEHQVAYTEHDVGTDPAQADEMVKISGQMGVPVIDINGRVIIGFDEPAIAAALSQ